MIDARSRDHVTVPRSGLEEAWMDVTAVAYETRRDVGRAYQAQQRGSDPKPHLFAADQRLLRLTEYARRKAGESAGLSYIDANQLPLWDGCGPDGSAA